MTTPLEQIEARMASGQNFTFEELWSPFEYETAFRLADRTIQKWRKAGLISFVRRDRTAIWSLTEAGKKFVSELKP